MNSTNRIIASRATSLTELEGAVLSEIHHRKHSTAFQVRRAFQLSPSVEWSGSAGAVYPVIKRLTAAGVIRSEALETARKTSHLSLTKHGESLLNDWIADVHRATGVGLDPFRLRAGLWVHLSAKRRREAFFAMRQSLNQEITETEEQIKALDPVEKRRAELAMLLQRLRLDWIDSELAAEAL